jgi:hypothetical protein
MHARVVERKADSARARALRAQNRRARTFWSKSFAAGYDLPNNNRKQKFAVCVVYLRYPEGTYLDANQNARSIAKSAPALVVC